MFAYFLVVFIVEFLDIFMYSGSESFVLQRFPSTPELIFSLSFKVSFRGKVFNFE